MFCYNTARRFALSNTVFVVIVVGIVLAMLVMMVKYAKFIHQYPQQEEKDRSGSVENAPDKPRENGRNE